MSRADACDGSAMKKFAAVLATLFTAEQRAEIRQRAQEKIVGLRLQHVQHLQQLRPPMSVDVRLGPRSRS